MSVSVSTLLQRHLATREHVPLGLGRFAVDWTCVANMGRDTPSAERRASGEWGLGEHGCGETGQRGAFDVTQRRGEVFREVVGTVIKVSKSVLVYSLFNASIPDAIADRNSNIMSWASIIQGE